MAVIGMSFGMMGFVFAMIAVSQLTAQDARIKALEARLGHGGEADADENEDGA